MEELSELLDRHKAEIAQYKQHHEAIDKVCKHFKITKEWLMGDCRRKIYVLCRTIIFNRLRNMGGLSLVQMGELLNRDHSTVIHHTREVVNPKVIYGKDWRGHYQDIFGEKFVRGWWV